jgi:ParB family chromosome partitioning protein
MALGRGLSSLIPSKTVDESSNLSAAQARVLEVAITEIRPNPHQPRKQFVHHAIEELVASIKEHGILQPLLVSKTASGYELIAGERRLRSAELAGLTTVPVIVRDVKELQKVELALIENIQRSDLNAIEKAEGYRKLLQEFGLTHEAAARKLGLSRSSFSNALRLLDLPGEMQKAIADGKISEGHAKLLLSLETDQERAQYFKLIQTDHLSVQRLSKAVSSKTKGAKPAGNTQQQAYQEELALALGTKVTITPKQIQIDYYSPEELAALVRKLKR